MTDLQQESIAPSLAITSDWWNQAARLEPISEALFNTQLLENEAAPVPPDIGPADFDGRHCPICGSIIYSRRHRLCGVCAHPLPAQALFSASESSRIQWVIEIERERHRQWLARVTS